MTKRDEQEQAGKLAALELPALIERAEDAHSGIEDDDTAQLVLKMLMALRKVQAIVTEGS